MKIYKIKAVFQMFNRLLLIVRFNNQIDLFIMKHKSIDLKIYLVRKSVLLRKFYLKQIYQNSKWELHCKEFQHILWYSYYIHGD